jgi:hypothetical protein
MLSSSVLLSSEARSPVRAELASLLAAGVLRLHERNVLGPVPTAAADSPNSAHPCLEVPASALLSVSSPAVNRVESPTHERSDT